MKVDTRRSPQFVKKVYASIPAYIDGTMNDTHGIGRVFWGHFTRLMFDKMYTSFLQRSLGAADDLGNTFEPLKENTIAKRPIGRNNLNKFGLTKKQSKVSFQDRRRGLLTPLENLLWKKEYSRVLFGLTKSLNRANAEEVAAKLAWTKVKKLGAKTRKAVLGKRQVLIMRVTDRLMNSLEPTEANGFDYRPRKDQLYKRLKSSVELGTLVEYAKFHDKTRPVIPENIQPWVDHSVEYAMIEVMEHIVNRVL